jgi:NADPH-dependent 2,4-dienoyl-CoA reductase/sulfur reductase-like enzyme
MLIDQVGFHQATGTAEFLAERGAQVKVLTPAFYPGQDLATTLDLELWHRRALAKGIGIVSNVVVLEIGEHSLRVLNHYSGREEKIEGIDAVVLALPAKADDALYFALKGRVKELYRIGDCVAPRRVHAAIWEGHRVGRSI